MSSFIAQEYLILSKHRVVMLMLVCAAAGMALAPHPHFSWNRVVFGLLGIGLAASAGGALNQWMEAALDQGMKRTAKRPLPRNQLSNQQVLRFIIVSSVLSIIFMAWQVNLLAMSLTLVTTLGYGIVYTRYLKPKTHQNIVIGGLSGAMPPLLGWVCMSPYISAEPLVLVLIIFCWTPAHFWALALAKKEEYAKTPLPMLPITHGTHVTTLFIMLYIVLTWVMIQLPLLLEMNGLLYGLGANLLTIRWLMWGLFLHRNPTKHNAMKAFVFSNLHLLGVFSFMLCDHFLS